MQEKISIIVPIYKVEKYLDECVKSIVNQTYSNIEIILVDDGSPDKCSKICDDWAMKDSRIKVVHKKNAGLAMARNTGVEVSSGEYIAFVDSDDYINADYCEKLYGVLKKNDAEIAGCRFYRNKINGDEYIYPPADSNFDFCIDPYTAMKRTYNDFGVFCVAWNKLYKRDIVTKHPFYDVKIAEDARIIRERFFACERIAWTQEPLYMYRNREGSIMTSSRNYNIDEMQQRLYWIDCDIKYYKENKIDTLRALAEKAYCYNLYNDWKFMNNDCKKFYKKRYFEKLRHLLFSGGNSIKSKIKYMSFGVKVVMS